MDRTFLFSPSSSEDQLKNIASFQSGWYPMQPGTARTKHSTSIKSLQSAIICEKRPIAQRCPNLTFFTKSQCSSSVRCDFPTSEFTINNIIIMFRFEFFLVRVTSCPVCGSFTEIIFFNIKYFY